MFEILQYFVQFCQQYPLRNTIRNGESIDRALERFLRFHPPKFHGKLEAEQDEEWLIKLEKILTKYQDEQKVSFAIYQLEDDAHHWWRVIDHHDNKIRHHDPGLISLTTSRRSISRR